MGYERANNSKPPYFSKPEKPYTVHAFMGNLGNASAPQAIKAYLPYLGIQPTELMNIVIYLKWLTV